MKPVKVSMFREIMENASENCRTLSGCIFLSNPNSEQPSFSAYKAGVRVTAKLIAGQVELSVGYVGSEFGFQQVDPQDFGGYWFNAFMTLVLNENGELQRYVSSPANQVTAQKVQLLLVSVDPAGVNKVVENVGFAVKLILTSNEFKSGFPMSIVWVGNKCFINFVSSQGPRIIDVKKFGVIQNTPRELATVARKLISGEITFATLESLCTL